MKRTLEQLLIRRDELLSIKAFYKKIENKPYIMTGWGKARAMELWSVERDIKRLISSRENNAILQVCRNKVKYL